MLYAWAEGSLEIRATRNGGAVITGAFPYNKLAVLDAGGKGRKPRKEKFGPKAFSFAVKDKGRNIHLLSGHDYAKPLSDKFGGGLLLEDSDIELSFRAEIAPELMEVTHVRDTLKLLASGLAVGVSPGFRVPDNIPDSEEITEEDPALGKALIRTVKKAVLHELSIVTAPAYKEASAQIEARCWQLSQTPARAISCTQSRYRWRA
jgi:HK97 family phage prohead protease